MRKERDFYIPEICIKCGGDCCKRSPAPYTPKDISRIFGGIEKAIDSGTIAIDWWEGDRPIYFVRPKTIKTKALYDPSWGGQCIHLRTDGCKLSRDKMPTFCKALEPKDNGECVDHVKRFPSKLLAAKLWKRSGIDLSKFNQGDQI